MPAAIRRAARAASAPTALLYGGADYWQHANDEVLVFAMVETREAVKNLDEIVSDIKAQADVLAQQARLHRCLTNPTTCQ